MKLMRYLFVLLAFTLSAAALASVGENHTLTSTPTETSDSADDCS
jgi:hypothetical protein